MKLNFPRSNKHNKGFIIGGLFRNYGRYLEHDLWLEKRSYFLKKNPTCQKCGTKAQCCHHTTYKNIGNEKERDLMALCLRCHNKIHSKNGN